MNTPPTPPAPEIGSSALLSPDVLLAALRTCTAATEELERMLNASAQEAFDKWHAKWGVLPDHIHIKGEPRGLKENRAVDFDASVKLRWELA